MTQDINASPRSRFSPGTSNQVDRVLLVVCAGLWLAALGAGVAAIVALVGLTGDHSAGEGEADTPWLLYTVIGVSAVVIIGAIPLLVRARRESSGSSFGLTPRDRAGAEPAADGPAPRLEPFGAPVIQRTPVPAVINRVGFPTAAVDQVWLRCTAIVVGAMGAALTLIGVGTYLLVSDHDTAAWILYGLAGVVTVATPVVPWFFLRQLRTVLGGSGPAPS